MTVSRSEPTGRRDSLPTLVEKMLGGNRGALARLFTLLDRDAETLAAIMAAIGRRADTAHCIGVTGPPGGGKSTLVDHLIQIFREDGHSIGVVAVDPTSPFTGGAVLGDRVRMQRHTVDQSVFIRSLATRGVHGGLSRVTRASVELMNAFGKHVIFVETVGVGQTELDIMKVADTVVVTLVPEAGDAVQVMKAGLTEIADIFVVNKADREGAGRLAASVKAALALGDDEPWWTPPVLLTQAQNGEGVRALHDAIVQHRETMEAGSRLDERRRARRKSAFVEALRDALEVGVADLTSNDGALSAMAARVEEGELDPHSAAAQVLNNAEMVAELARAFQSRSQARTRDTT